VIIALAGHVDHGKTALIRALTGIDADRLPEEKQRGMTIDLGFAHVRLKSARWSVSSTFRVTSGFCRTCSRACCRSIPCCW
jgi:selenocysteine-specific translation elongation factor